MLGPKARKLTTIHGLHAKKQMRPRPGNWTNQLFCHFSQIISVPCKHLTNMCPLAALPYELANVTSALFAIFSFIFLSVPYHCFVCLIQILFVLVFLSLSFFQSHSLDFTFPIFGTCTIGEHIEKLLFIQFCPTQILRPN